MRNKPIVADQIAAFIAEKNGLVFQLSGGMIAFITDAINELGETKIVNNRHEQASGFGAEGATRATDIPSFAMGTSGPGATNLATAIASSYFDSIPVIYITGQVHTSELKKSKLQRQNGFQELDVCKLVEGITKKTYKPITSKEVAASLEDGWSLAQEGRKGPVLIDIPIDVQQLKWDKEVISDRFNATELHSSDNFRNSINSLKEALKTSRYPLVISGGGIRLDGAIDELDSFINMTNLPVVSTLMGIDSFDHTDKRYLGFFGSYGNRWANEALAKSDLLIVLGSRLDIRQIGSDIPKFQKNKTIVRVDIDPEELNGRIVSDIEFQMGVKDFLIKAQSEISYCDRNDLQISAELSKHKFPQESEQVKELALNPSEIMKILSDVYADYAGYVVDVGQHQMWAAQSIELKSSQRFLTSGGLGAMGFAVPASIGAAISTKKPWVVIVGDGCLQLSIAELQTIIQYELPISICVFNNNQHGMVAQFQDENMAGRHIGTRDGYSTPNFIELAKAYGFRNLVQIDSTEELKDLQKTISEWPEGPSLIEICISPDAKALPKMNTKKQG